PVVGGRARSPGARPLGDGRPTPLRRPASGHHRGLGRPRHRLPGSVRPPPGDAHGATAKGRPTPRRRLAHLKPPKPLQVSISRAPTGTKPGEPKNLERFGVLGCCGLQRAPRNRTPGRAPVCSPFSKVTSPVLMVAT